MSINKTISAIEPRKLRSFKKFSLSKHNGSVVGNETDRVKAAIKRKLEEAADVENDVASSIFAVLEAGSSNREETLQLLANGIDKMSEKMDIAVTVVAIL